MIDRAFGLVLLAPLQLVSLRHEVDVLERPACTAMRLGWAAAARGVDDTVEGDERGVDQGAHCAVLSQWGRMALVLGGAVLAARH